MQVIRAETMGLCFGVRDALELAFGQEDATEITVYGELVHNATVLDGLREQGFHLAPEEGRETAVDTDRVLITAHGISNRERSRLEARGKELIDTTCPLVQKVHNAALRLQEAGYFPIVIGKHGHVEVRGIVGDLEDYAVVADVAEAEQLGTESQRLGVVCQTTFPADRAQAIRAALERAHPDAEVRFHDTTCDPTRRRQAALRELLRSVEAMVVVGGANSNNSRQLARACEEAGVPAVLLQGPDDVDPTWFEDFSVIGLTAGTSTLDADVAAVEERLRDLEVLQKPRVGAD